MSKISTSITLNGKICLLNKPSTYRHNASPVSSYWCPVGPMPGVASVLMTRGDLLKIQEDDTFTLKFRTLSDTDLAANTATFIALGLVKSERISTGEPEDPDGVYVVQLADKRYLLERWSDTGEINANIRSYASSTDHLTGTGSATWASLSQAIWETMSPLGTFPGLPYAPDGVPENWRFHGVNSWEALHEVLGKIGCTTAYNPFTAGFSIVRLGAEQIIESTTRFWSSLVADPLESLATKVPETIRVYFATDYKSIGQERDTELATNWSTTDAADFIDVLTGVEGAVAGTILGLWDDMPRLLNEDNTLTNLSALTTRASERSTNWLLDAQVGRNYDVLIGTRTEFLPGSQVKAVLWRYWPGGGQMDGTATEVIRHPGLPIGFTGRSLSTTQFAPVNENIAPPDLARKTFPGYPRLPNLVQIDDSGASPGADVTPNADNLFPGHVVRWVAGSLVTLDDCWIRLIDEHDTLNGDMTAKNNDIFTGRLSGVETSESVQNPIYLARKGGDDSYSWIISDGSGIATIASGETVIVQSDTNDFGRTIWSTTDTAPGASHIGSMDFMVGSGLVTADFTASDTTMPDDGVDSLDGTKTFFGKVIPDTLAAGTLFNTLGFSGSNNDEVIITYDHDTDRWEVTGVASVDVNISERIIAIGGPGGVGIQDSIWTIAVLGQMSATLLETTNDGISMGADVLTSGSAFSVSANLLSSGSIFVGTSSSPNITTRTLFDFANENSASSNTTVLALKQNASHRAFYVDMNGDEGPAVRIEHNSNSSSDQYAIEIVAANAGVGDPGGVDFSTFPIDTPLIAVPDDGDAPADFGTLGHFSVMLDGAIGKVPVFDDSHPFAVPVAANPVGSEDGAMAYDATVTLFQAGVLKYSGAAQNMGLVAMPSANFESAYLTSKDGFHVAYSNSLNGFELVEDDSGSWTLKDDAANSTPISSGDELLATDSTSIGFTVNGPDQFTAVVQGTILTARADSGSNQPMVYGDAFHIVGGTNVTTSIADVAGVATITIDSTGGSGDALEQISYESVDEGDVSGASPILMTDGVANDVKFQAGTGTRLSESAPGTMKFESFGYYAKSIENSNDLLDFDANIVPGFGGGTLGTAINVKILVPSSRGTNVRIGDVLQVQFGTDGEWSTSSGGDDKKGTVKEWTNSAATIPAGWSVHSPMNGKKPKGKSDLPFTSGGNDGAKTPTGTIGGTVTAVIAAIANHSNHDDHSHIVSQSDRDIETGTASPKASQVTNQCTSGVQEVNTCLGAPSGVLGHSAHSGNDPSHDHTFTGDSLNTEDAFQEITFIKRTG